MPTLSLCLIAKNEAAMIGACLRSVQGWVDQIVVVDTGSSDDTVAIAKQHGAEVFFSAWKDDFAYARNAALDKARCDWVLVLDCDEQMASGAGAAILKAIQNPVHEAYLLPLTDAARLDATADSVVDGSQALREPLWLARLFRRTPDLRWEGRVHENVSSWLERRGGRVGTVIAPIAHYGCVPEYRAERGNSDRNLRLLQSELEENPGDWFSRAYLLEECLVRGHPDALGHARLLEAQIVQQLLPSVAAQKRGQHGVVKALTAVCVVRLKHREFREVAGLIDQAYQATIRHPNLDFLRGLSFENSAHSELSSEPSALESALSAYMRVLSGEDEVWVDPLIEGIRSWNGLVRMGTVLNCLGQAKDALEAFVLAAHHSGEIRADIELGKAESLNALGRCEEALAILLPLMEDAPNSADVAILAAESCDILGQHEASQDFWNLAIRCAKENLEGLHRLQRLNARFAA